MRTPAEVALVIHLAAEGLNKCEIARVSGIPRGTVRTWLAGEIPDFERKLTYLPHLYWSSCPVCAGEPDTLPRAAYVYLLGLYLGDGCLAQHPRTYKLRIFCADAYPGLMRLCEEAISEVLPTTRVGRVQKEGCSEITSYSKHWICLFPQHGPGMKHTRKIELADWQQALVDVDPRPLVRGLIHSDGCRVLNRAYGTHYPPYPRYEFTNESAGIRRIFERACDAIGVEWRYNKPNTISVAKRASVAILDSFIGPKS